MAVTFFTLSCIAVSWFWFFSLALVGRQTGKLDKSGKFMTLLNKISAVIMWGTAIYLSKTLFT
jgi:L-lysine exporter family protein LysE/ArgO